MTLLELEPQWTDAGGEGISHYGQPVPARHGIGVIFNCPCGVCGTLCYVPFANPLDGSRPDGHRAVWQRTGETFETLTLTPSILRSTEQGGCGWHGFVTNGQIVHA